MRKIIDEQMELGQIDIAAIDFDLRSRDEIPKLLMGLQYIYCTPYIQKEVFIILEEMILKEKIDPKNGRKGMDLWKILVLGTIRLNCNWDYDKLHNIVNEHKTIREMLGHGMGDENYRYPLQTLKDNVSLLTEEILGKINEIVVKAGHKLIKRNDDEALKVKCDSTVVKTDVHYPTDINLLLDAIRKVITLVAKLCEKNEISGWRQFKKNIAIFKQCYRKAQNKKKSRSKNNKKKENRENEIIKAHRDYINIALIFLARAEETIKQIPCSDIMNYLQILNIVEYMQDARLLIDQITRRVINGEVIPHDEKIFSIFERHTEWISKGKAGVPQELGLNACIVQDQYGFILHHKVMQNETDKDIAVKIVEETKEQFKNITSCSFDRGFHTPNNRVDLEKILDKVILPKKGKLSSEDKKREYDEEFLQEKKKHSAIESAIGAIKNHGLDRCLDHGIDGFKNYVALAVAARNIQILGHYLQQKKLKKLIQQSKLKYKGREQKKAS